MVCTNVANAVFAAWVDDHPAGLLALSSRQRYLALAAVDGIGVVPYIVIGTLRIAAAFVVCHLAGRAYRDSILRVFTRYLGLTPEALEAYHRGLDKAEVLIIPFFVGSNIVAALTGVRRTHPGKLAVLSGEIGSLRRARPGPGLVGWPKGGSRRPLARPSSTSCSATSCGRSSVSIALVLLVNVRNFRTRPRLTDRRGGGHTPATSLDRVWHH